MCYIFILIQNLNIFGMEVEVIAQSPIGQFLNSKSAEMGFISLTCVAISGAHLTLNFHH